MNEKIAAFLMACDQLTEVEFMALRRGDLVRISNACFNVMGEAEHELEWRCKPGMPREDFELN